MRRRNEEGDSGMGGDNTGKNEGGTVKGWMGDGLRKRVWKHWKQNDRGREVRHGRGDSLTFIRIFWEYGLSAEGCITEDRVNHYQIMTPGHIPKASIKQTLKSYTGGRSD